MLESKIETKFSSWFVCGQLGINLVGHLSITYDLLRDGLGHGSAQFVHGSARHALSGWAERFGTVKVKQFFKITRFPLGTKMNKKI